MIKAHYKLLPAKCRFWYKEKKPFGRRYFKNVYSSINGKWYNEKSIIRFDNYSISPVMIQVLLQWDYELVELKMICYNLFLCSRKNELAITS